MHIPPWYWFRWCSAPDIWAQGCFHRSGSRHFAQGRAARRPRWASLSRAQESGLASLQSEPETLSGSGLGSLPACPWVQESRGLAGVAFGAAVGASYGVTVDTGAATSGRVPQEPSSPFRCRRRPGAGRQGQEDYQGRQQGVSLHVLSRCSEGYALILPPALALPLLLGSSQETFRGSCVPGHVDP